MAGNKILPFGTAYSAMCPMIYDSININWWWWSRITQTMGVLQNCSLICPTSHLDKHLPRSKTFASLKIGPLWNICSRELDQKLGKVILSGKHFLKTVASLSLSVSTLALAIYCGVCVYTSLSAAFCVSWCSWKETGGAMYAAASVWDRGHMGHMN